MRATDDQIVAGFNKWLAEWQADPDSFTSEETQKGYDPSNTTYGANCLRTLKRCITGGAS